MTDKAVVDEQLHRYYALWRESNAVYEDWAKKQGLSFNSLLVLYSFDEHGESCTQKMISQEWTIPKQTVNTILKDFEKKGYIELVPLPADKRNKVIRLTPAGRAFCDRMIAALHEKELLVMKKMGLSRMAELNDSLALFIELFRKGDLQENV